MFQLYSKDSVEFYFLSRNWSKNFWKCCIAYHAFFRCHTVQQNSNRCRSRSRVVSRGSSFRYNWAIADYVVLVVAALVEWFKYFLGTVWNMCVFAFFCRTVGTKCTYQKLLALTLYWSCTKYLLWCQLVWWIDYSYLDKFSSWNYLCSIK